MRRWFRSPARHVWPWIYGIALAAVPPLVACADESPPDLIRGQQIYTATCSACHGPQGEGSEEHAAPLVGDRSVAQLAGLIGETMPADDPGSLSDEENRAVAAYIHDTFYSPIARARNQPARIGLARLTVRQYRLAVADLIGSFRQPPSWGDERGLSGEYFKGRQPRGRNERAASRVDRQIDFDFGTEAPVPEIDEPRVYSIRWSGSLLAPETGEYEFVVRTEHAARLWINDMRVPIIDAWVKSGDETEYRASQYLVAGRPYSVKLEFTKAKQGVDDSRKQKEKPPSAPATIALLWQPPHGVPEPIPARQLSSQATPEAYICAVPFPPDDRSYGWERGTAISPAWDEATTAAAIDATGYVAARLEELSRIRPDDKDRDEKLRKFCETFAERAFRAPLGDDLRDVYIERQFAATESPEVAVRRVLLLVLKSPRFLYREVGGAPGPYDTAARLSFGLWDSIPDERLLEAARAGRLETSADVKRQAERMLNDPRARAKLREFLLKWLHVAHPSELSKDPEAFPDFEASLAVDLRTSLQLFLDDVLWSETSNFRRLLLAEEVLLNRRLAEWYATKAADAADSPEAEARLEDEHDANEQDLGERHSKGGDADESDYQEESRENADPTAEKLATEFDSIRLDDGKRAGVLTHPYVLARFAYSRETSPIHRGVFLARGIMGQTLRPPPEAFAPLPPELHPDLTTRERVTLQTKASQCMTCHSIINPLGFALERYDAVGRYRERDGEAPIDDVAEYQGRDGKIVNFRGARELAEYLADSDECHAAFTEQLFHHLVQQPIRAYGSENLEELRRSFVENEFNIRQLVVEIMVASAPVGRETEVAARVEESR